MVLNLKVKSGVKLIYFVGIQVDSPQWAESWFTVALHRQVLVITLSRLSAPAGAPGVDLRINGLLLPD